MNGASDTTKLNELVNAFSSLPATENLIFFVAAENGMLTFCQSLVAEYDRNPSSELIRQLNQICFDKGVVCGMLLTELRKVLLALNHLHNNHQDHYKILGLTPDASFDEVKKAYRKLSMRYHPDRGKIEGDADRFMEITGAYHACMINSGNQNAIYDAHWSNSGIHRQSNLTLRNNKKVVSTIIILLALLITASFFVAESYKDQIISDHIDIGSQPVATKKTSPKNTPEKPSPMQEPSPEIRKDTEPPVFSFDGDAALNTPSYHDSIEPDHTPIVQNQKQVKNPAAAIYPINKNSYSLADISVAPTPGLKAKQSVPETKIELPPRKTTEAENEKQQVDRSTTRSSSDVKVNAVPQVAEKELQADRIKKINTELKINQVLKQYTRLYNRKQLKQFLLLFTDNAMENGLPVTKELETYRKLFVEMEKINLRTENIRWNEYQDGFQVQADFIGDYTFRNGSEQTYTGNMIFYLVNVQENLKIQSLDYVFAD